MLAMYDYKKCCFTVISHQKDMLKPVFISPEVYQHQVRMKYRKKKQFLHDYHKTICEVPA